MPKVAQVEPITTARVLRGPFDYSCPEGAEVGSVLIVPFGGRDLLAVVTALKDSSEHELSEPKQLLPASLPIDLVALGPWLADEYCSTPARAYSLMLPPRGVKERSALYASQLREPDEGERLTDNQRQLLGTLPRLAGADVAALRRLEKRGLVQLDEQSQRRAPQHAEVGKASGKSGPPLTADQAAALEQLLAASSGVFARYAGAQGMRYASRTRVMSSTSSQRSPRKSAFVTMERADSRSHSPAGKPCGVAISPSRFSRQVTRCMKPRIALLE